MYQEERSDSNTNQYLRSPECDVQFFTLNFNKARIIEDQKEKAAQETLH
jgi:hypothetical protein